MDVSGPGGALLPAVGFCPASEGVGGLPYVEGYLLTPACLTSGQTYRPTPPGCSSGPRGAWCLCPSSPSWPWQKFRGSLRSPRDQQALRPLVPESGCSPEATQGGPGASCPGGRKGSLGPQLAVVGHKPWQVTEAGRMGRHPGPRGGGERCITLSSWSRRE